MTEASSRGFMIGDGVGFVDASGFVGARSRCDPDRSPTCEGQLACVLLESTHETISVPLGCVRHWPSVDFEGCDEPPQRVVELEMSRPRNRSRVPHLPGPDNGKHQPMLRPVGPRRNRCRVRGRTSVCPEEGRKWLVGNTVCIVGGLDHPTEILVALTETKRHK